MVASNNQQSAFADQSFVQLPEIASLVDQREEAAVSVADRLAVCEDSCRLLDETNEPQAVWSKPSRRIRKASKPAVSPAQRRLAEGKEIVAADGNLSPLYLAAKRTFDITGALVLLAVLWPVMTAVWVVLLVTTRRNPIFCQKRLGLLGRPFTLYKFQTMVPNAEKLQQAVANEKDGPIFKNRRDPRITRLGRILRSTSIDEMPQLFNVLAGQMALVGPRPPIGKEVADYEPWQRRRLAVKPGLTCLWQVSGRSEIGFEQWVRMDLWYARHQNFPTDLKLLVQTPWTVITGRGAY